MKTCAVVQTDANWTSPIYAAGINGMFLSVLDRLWTRKPVERLKKKKKKSVANTHKSPIQVLLCDSEKGQLHVDSGLGASFHEWNAIFLQHKHVSGTKGTRVGITGRPSLPWPASRPPPSSRPSQQPCRTVKEQREREGKRGVNKSEGSRMSGARVS